MKNIVIVGGGFAGVWAAMSAAAERNRQGLSAQEMAITLISKDPAFRSLDHMETLSRVILLRVNFYQLYVNGVSMSGENYSFRIRINCSPLLFY